MTSIRTSTLLFALLAFPACALAGQPDRDLAVKPAQTECTNAATTTVDAACIEAQRKADRRRMLAERRAAQRVARWEQRKRMCRELGVRFDRSGLCW